MRVLVDTCVIIDVLQDRQPFAADAKELFLAVANNLLVGCITAKSVSDIYYLSHHYTHSDKAAREILNKLFTLFELVDTKADDCRKAIWSETSDYEDAIMIETAISANVSYIVTRNEKDYTSSAVPVYSPQEFLVKLKSDTL
jgi:predicted nucleic acid-binding protein